MIDFLYCKSMGKVFKVRRIARTTEEANDFCAKHDSTGVIAEDKSGLIYIADLYSSTVPSGNWPYIAPLVKDKETQAMIKFQAGRTYAAGSYRFTVTRRTDISVWITERPGMVPQRKFIRVHNDTESIAPYGAYSSVPVLKAIL